MTKSQKAAVADCLERLRKHTEKFAKLGREIARIEKDHAVASATVEEIGEPSYNDDEALDRLARAQRKVAACEKALEDANARVLKLFLDNPETGDSNPVRAEMADLLNEGSRIATEALKVIADRRLDTVAATIRPFCFTAEVALEVARKTDVCRQAVDSVARYGALGNSLLGQPSISVVLATVAKLERVLTEITKDAPDYMQFFATFPVSGGVGAPDKTGSSVG